jgi:hypothetical protein
MRSTASFVSSHPTSSRSRYELRGEMLSKGYQEIGSGCYGTVYAHPDQPDEVVKVGTYQDWNGQGTPYDGWVGYVLTFGDRQHSAVPRVHSLELHRDHYVARMERLFSALEVNRQWVLAKEWAVRLGAEENGGRVTKYDGCYPSTLPGYLGALGEDIEEWARRNGHGCDCHQNNVMFRRDGSPVITDPVT